MSSDLFSLPNDPPRIAAALLAVVAAVWAPQLLAKPFRQRVWGPRFFAAVAAVVAATFSAAYCAYYLAGAPRIIDATAYWLQARGLAEGWVAWPTGTPDSSVLGRFLLPTAAPINLFTLGPLAKASLPSSLPSALHGGAAVIFPPGYATVLALGWAVGVPLAVGPLIAAALVLLTMALAKRIATELTRDRGDRPRFVRLSVRLAGVFSICCATLRYHTADTMAHGLAALCLLGSLWAALNALERNRCLSWAVGSGLAGGWLLATRPVSAMALLPCFVVGAAAYRRRQLLRSRRWLGIVGGLLLGAIPGICWWFAYQYLTTGSTLGTAQQSYYALSDGPPGCFSYGFGPHIGCAGEHGPFVHANLSRGYGVAQALATTARRLSAHLADPLNFPPLFLLIPLGLYFARASASARVVGVGIVALVLCYLPFYFDGNYPGGGARMFADVLPLEHALAAIAVAAIAARRPVAAEAQPALAGARSSGLLLGACLFGFAFHTGPFHQHLSGRNNGRPYFEADIWRTVKTAGAMLFMDSDHGFDLAFEPGSDQPRIVRFRGDDLDRLAWEARGRPAAFRYHRGAAPRDEPTITPLSFDQRPTAQLPLHIEGESLWPARSQMAGWAWPEWTSQSCASGRRWLVVRPALEGAKHQRATVTLKLPSVLSARQLRPRVFLSQTSQRKVIIELLLTSGGRVIHRWKLDSTSWGHCLDLPPAQIPSTKAALLFTIVATVPVALDRLNLAESHLP